MSAFTPEERDRLEQELWELHFGCHPDPAALQARLDAEPELAALQREVLAGAELVAAAARPVTPPLQLQRQPKPPASTRPPAWYRRPAMRLLLVAAAGLLVVLAAFGRQAWDARGLQRARQDALHLTVTAPQAVPVGAPWSFTVQARDLHGEAATCDVEWRLRGNLGDGVMAQGTVAVSGDAAVAMAPVGRLTVPDGDRTAMAPVMSVGHRLEVTAQRGGTSVRQELPIGNAAAAPLVHVTTDKPVYRPGEPVHVRAVALDRVTLAPLPQATRLAGRVLDPRGSVVAQLPDRAIDGPGTGPAGVGAFVWQVPADSRGGEHRLEIVSPDGAFPAEAVPFVVRSYQPPRLRQTVVLDRKTYPPGGTGAAELRVERMGGGPAAGASVRAGLVLDGTEVWQQDGRLDSQGRAVFRFAVPQQVVAGAARFVARVTDGGMVETEVKPFVVPTGRVQVACFPEGGDLVADVRNRVYLEVTDPLGRPVDTTGSVVDASGREVAAFVTEHQGRARVEFTPTARVGYRVITAAGGEATFPLPAVLTRGVALRALDQGVPAGASLRLRLAGGGDGPWMVGAFCRGVLVAQLAVRADVADRIDRALSLTLPEAVSGVLRVTVFDRNMMPVAERLVQRAARRQVAVELQPARAALAPGARQTVAITTRDEDGRPVAAAVGLTVTDAAALAMGREPRIGLLDQALLFGDVERGEDLGDFCAGGADAARNVDLLLGTRGWRRFVWRNDAAAQERIAAAGAWASGVLAREGFAQRPQAVSNLAEAQAPLLEQERAAASSRQRAGRVLSLTLLLLLVVLAAEGAWWAARCLLRLPPVGSMLLTGVGSAAALVVVVSAMERMGADLPAPADRLLWDFDERAAGAADLVALPAAMPVPDPAGPMPGGPVDGADFFLGGGRAAAGGNGLVVQADTGVAADAPDFEPMLQPQAEELADDGRRGRAGEGRQRPVREYAHRNAGTAQRDDFTETVCWSPLLVTDADGRAEVAFDLSDAVTTWRVQADAHATGAEAGRVGQATASFHSRLPLHVDAKLPVAVAAGDRLRIPVAITLEDGDGDAAAVEVALTGPVSLDGPASLRVPLTAGRGRVLVPVQVGGEAGTATITVRCQTAGCRDEVSQTIPVVPRGFPHVRSFGGQVVAGEPSMWTVPVPGDAAPGSGRLVLRVFPSPLSSLQQGLDGMLQEPHGCFEQASSSNYPNVMVLSWLEASGDDLPAVAARARELLPRGYRKITGYECRERGYEWFGGDPGHEALTAYGLLQFRDMAAVHEVDAGMVARTRAWLLGRRDGQGGFLRSARALDSFGRAPDAVTNAYIVSALLQAGTPAAELARELDALAARAARTDDAYELALAAAALAEAGRPEAPAARQRLAGMQRPDGSLLGSTTSITSSRGDDLAVETTALCLLAWLPDAALAGPVRAAVQFLQSRQTGRGTFGATQATVLALRALTAFARATRATAAPGTVRVFVDGRLVAGQDFAAGQAEALTFALWPFLRVGDAEVRLEVEGGGGPLAWACDLAYHSDVPADDPDAAVGIRTALSAGMVAEGATVSLQVVVINRTAEGLPMTMAAVGLPAGLDLPTAVLADRQQAGAFDLWELRGRELVLYWRGLAPEAERRVELDLVARVPGVSTGPASRAWLYYTPGQQRWAPGLAVDVTPGR